MDSEKLTPEELTEEELTEEEPTEEELEEARRRLYAHLAQGEADVKAGRVHPIEEVFDEIMRELDSLSLDDLIIKMIDLVSGAVAFVIALFCTQKGTLQPGAPLCYVTP